MSSAEDLLIPGAIILLLMVMGGGGGGSESPEKQVQFDVPNAKDIVREAAYHTLERGHPHEKAFSQATSSGYSSLYGVQIGDPPPRYSTKTEVPDLVSEPESFETEHEPIMQPLLTTAINRKDRAMEAIRMINKTSEAARLDLTAGPVEKLRKVFLDYTEQFIGPDGSLFTSLAKGLGLRRARLAKNIDNPEFQFSGESVPNRTAKIIMIEQIDDELREFQQVEEVSSTALEKARARIEEFGLVTVEKEQIGEKDIEKPSETPIVKDIEKPSKVDRIPVPDLDDAPNFQSKTNDATEISSALSIGNVTLHTPSESRIPRPKTVGKLSPVLESHQSYLPRTPDRISRTLHGDSPKRPKPVLNPQFVLSTGPNPAAGFQQLQGPSSAPPKAQTVSKTAPTSLAGLDHSKFVAFNLLIKKIRNIVASAVKAGKPETVHKQGERIKKMGPPGYEEGSWYESVKMNSALTALSGETLEQDTLKRDRFYTAFAQLVKQIEAAEQSLL